MTKATKDELPIGYWLKRADNLLTDRINKAQTVNGVSRSDWQVLNMLNEAGSASKEQIFERMRTFVDASSFDEIITRLIGRGWVERSGVSHRGKVEFQLTEDGRRQHGIILAVQKELRQRAMRGIGDEEYSTTIRVLKRIVSNLEENGDGVDSR